METYIQRIISYLKEKGRYIQDYYLRLGKTTDDIVLMSELALYRFLVDIELEISRDYPDYFVRRFCVYEDKDAEELIQPFNMWEAQSEALQSIHDNRLNIILKARQLGISWLVISYASYVMRMRSGRTVIGLSRTEDEAMELVRRLSVEFANMGSLIREKKESQGWNGVTYEKFAMKLVVHFPNEPDSVFYAFPSAPGSVRSFTADLAIFDEWAFQQWAEQIWVSAAPTINRPTGGKFIGLSTNQRGSLFESIFTDKSNGFNKIFIPWNADPRRDKEWYERTKAMLGGDITQEYPATIEEALSVSGGAMFPEVTVESHISQKPLTGILNYFVSIDYGFDKFAAYVYRVDVNFNAQVFIEIFESNLNAMQAADMLRDIVSDYKIEYYLAPPDLWNRQSSTGKSTADVFAEHGIVLIKVDNNFENGVSRMKEWLYAEENEQAKLTIYQDSAPNLFRSLSKIQKDKNRPNVYAKQPHELTHACLSGDTLIKTTEGDIPIAELVGKEGSVYCWNGDEIVTKHFDSVCMTNPSKEVFEIELEDGTIIKATADHKILTDSGYKEVKDLTFYDEVCQFCLDSA